MAQESFRRKLSAILSADVVGYSRLMGEDEDSTVRNLASHRDVISSLIIDHKGRVVDSSGDNILAEFVSVVAAMRCAWDVQKEIKLRNANLPENRRMNFRIGINLGDVIEEEGKIYGDGVNIAARLQGLAEEGGICISGTAYDQVKNKLPFRYEYQNEKTVKNINEPVRVYKVLMGLVADELISDKKVELPQKPSIAVLPFVNMSSDPNQEYFSDGITEEIITGLSKVSHLFVIARNSTFTYKGKAVKVQQVGQDLGVRYVLEGSVRKERHRVRITAQLIDTKMGHHLWAERFDRDLKDIFALQDEITMKILVAMQLKLTEGEQARLYGKGTNSLEAYVKLLQGRQHMHLFNTESNVLSRQMFEEAIASDPEYAMAHIYLAISHILDVWFGSSAFPRESMTRSLELVQRAISIDESLPESHGVLGIIYLMQRQHEKAIAEGELAVACNSNSADDHARLGLTLSCAGRPHEAILLHKKAIRLNPTPPSWYLTVLGFAYGMKGLYQEAITAFKRALHRSPDNLLAWQWLTAAYSLSDRDDEARDAAKEVLRIKPEFSLEFLVKTLPFKNQTDTDLIIGALRKVGLPE